MLDELLGRAELKARIEELEEARRELERRLEAEEERRRAAVHDRQQADERVNKLEDRIADLEGQLERARGDEEEASFSRVETLDLERTKELVGRLESVTTGQEGALSAYIDEESRPDGVAETVTDGWALLDRARPCLAYADDFGVLRVLCNPPLPPEPFVSWSEGFRVHPAWFLPQGRFAMALVRSDLFALGVYKDDERLEFDGFESDVKEAHSKGGFSQSRFERRRDQQIDEHLERCHNRLGRLDVERLIVVGQRTLLSEFRERATATAAVDATGKPNEALADAYETFWRTRIYLP